MDACLTYFFENGEFRFKFSITVGLVSASEFSILGVTQLVSYSQRLVTYYDEAL